MTTTGASRRAEQFRGNTDFAIRWPPHLVAEEIQRLLRSAELDGETPSWQSEVTLLLRQAFTTETPAREFEISWRSNSSNYLTRESDEPF